MEKNNFFTKMLCVFLAIAMVLIFCGCAKKSETEEVFYEHFVPTVAESENNTKIGWGLKKEKNAPPQVPESQSNVLKKYGAVYIDEVNEKNLYLTFDEGYENGYTAKILDVLKKTNTPAAFFVTGDYIKTQPALVKRMYDEGFCVGNHTNHHPSMPDKDNEKLTEEIESLNKMYNDLTGDNMKYFRPPMGEYSERTLALTSRLGYRTVFWSFAYADWEKNKIYGAQHAFDSVVPYLHGGAIILLHAVSQDNADALESIINWAKDAGYTFKSLDELPQA